MHELIERSAYDPIAAAKVAAHRAYMVEAQRRYRNKMYAEAETGEPQAVERYEHFLQVRRDAYWQKQEEAR